MQSNDTVITILRSKILGVRTSLYITRFIPCVCLTRTNSIIHIDGIHFTDNQVESDNTITTFYTSVLTRIRSRCCILQTIPSINFTRTNNCRKLMVIRCTNSKIKCNCTIATILICIFFCINTSLYIFLSIPNIRSSITDCVIQHYGICRLNCQIHSYNTITPIYRRNSNIVQTRFCISKRFSTYYKVLTITNFNRNGIIQYIHQSQMCICSISSIFISNNHRNLIRSWSSICMCNNVLITRFTISKIPEDIIITINRLRRECYWLFIASTRTIKIRFYYSFY